MPSQQVEMASEPTNPITTQPGTTRKGGIITALPHNKSLPDRKTLPRRRFSTDPVGKKQAIYGGKI